MEPFNPWKKKEWTSNAQWPEGSFKRTCSGQKSTDFHLTEAAAKAVCNMLERDGLGGEGEIFPLRTWVAKIGDENEK